MKLAWAAQALIAAIALLGVLLTLPASAGADHSGGETLYSQKSPDGDRGLVATHEDPTWQFAAGSDEIALPRGGGLRSRGARAIPDPSPTTCPPVANTGDNTANSPYSGAPNVFKVIYGYTTDHSGGNQFAADAPVIQAGIRGVADWVLSESGGLFAPRFDLGTTAGSNCLDIQTIALPHDTAHYQAHPGFPNSFRAITFDIGNLLGYQPGYRNYVVYLDDLPIGTAAGEGSRYATESAGGGLQNSGDLFALLYGRGGTDFFFSGSSFPAGTTSRQHVEIALHEITHNLGAVGPSSPHSTMATHCNDEFDVMCYSDGGPSSSLFTSSSCDGVNPPVDPYASDMQAWDCNRDDYFSLDPAPGSYLGVNWNIANSDFLVCEAASCPRPGIRPGPEAAAPATPAAAVPAPATKKKKKKKKKKKRKRR